MFELIWAAMIGALVLGTLAHHVASREWAREHPDRAGLGWLGEGPSSERGRVAYQLKRLFTVVAILLALVAILMGDPSAP